MTSTTWHLSFRAATGRALTEVGDALAAVAGQAPAWRNEPWSGNPRDGYARWQHLEVTRGGLTLGASALQWAYGPAEEGPADTARLVEKKMFPPPGLQRAEALKWLVWTNVSLGGAIMLWFHATAGVPEAEHASDAWVKRGAARPRFGVAMGG